MEKMTFKDKIRDIEHEWASLDRDADSAAWTNMTANLYHQLIEQDAVHYFESILAKTGIAFSQVAKETEDYLVDIWMEANRLYDPSKGRLMDFITSRLTQRIKDDARKKYGMVSQPREEKKPSFFSADELSGTGDEEKGKNILDDWAFQKYSQQGSGDIVESLIMDAQLCELASQILHFMENHKTGKNADRNHMFYKLFYSAGIINYLKDDHEPVPFQHERDNMAAMHFRFTNFCTDRGQQYGSKSDLTVAAILQKDLARQGEALPQDKVEKLTEEEKDKMLGVPLQNEVFRGYLERAENDKVSSALISQRLKMYREEMKTRLQEKELI